MCASLVLSKLLPINVWGGEKVNQSNILVGKNKIKIHFIQKVPFDIYDWYSWAGFSHLLSHMSDGLSNNTLLLQNRLLHCRVLKKKKANQNKGSKWGRLYDAKGPSKALGGHLTGHAHACTITLVCVALGSVGGRWPFALWTSERRRRHILFGTTWAVKRRMICQAYSFSAECEKEAEQRESCRLLF